MFKLPIAPYDWSAVIKRLSHHHFRGFPASLHHVDASLRHRDADLFATASAYQSTEEVVDVDWLRRTIDTDGLVHDVEAHLVAQEIIDPVCRTEVEPIFNRPRNVV